MKFCPKNENLGKYGTRATLNTTITACFVLVCNRLSHIFSVNIFILTGKATGCTNWLLQFQPWRRILTLWQNTLAYFTKAFNIMQLIVKCEILPKKWKFCKYGTRATFYTKITACSILVCNRLSHIFSVNIFILTGKARGCTIWLL